MLVFRKKLRMISCSAFCMICHQSLRSFGSVGIRTITYTRFIPAWDVGMYFVWMKPISIGVSRAFAKIQIMATVMLSMQRQQPMS